MGGVADWRLHSRSVANHERDVKRASKKCGCWLSRFLSLVASFPRFIRLMEIESGLNIVAVRESALSLLFDQPFTDVVAPAALGHERIPDENLFLVWPVATLKTPFQNFFVAPALQGAFYERVVINAKKSNAASVKTEATIVIRQQLALRVQPDFIEHSSEEHYAANFFV